MEKRKSSRVNVVLTDIRKDIASRSRKELLFAILPWLCLAAAYLAAVLFQLIYGKQLLNSDMSAEMLLANHLNESGSFVISKDWYYSTELRVLYQQLTLQLGLILFPHNWHLARTFSQAVLLALYAVCYLFLTRECGLGRAGVYSAAILMCPFGFWYMWYGTYNGAYLYSMILASLNLALIFHIIREKKYRPCIVCLFVLLSFVEGLSGVRMLMNFYGPLFATAGILFFLGLQQKSVTKVSDAAWELTFLKTAFVSTAACGAGYLVNTGVLSQTYSFTNYSIQYWVQFDPDRILSVLGQFFSVFGYPYQSNFTEGEWQEIYLFSKEGILGAFGLVLLLAVVFSVIRLSGRWKELRPEHRTVLLLLYMCLLLDGIVYACLMEETQVNESYWLPVVPIVIAVLAIELKTEYFHFPVQRGAVTAAVLVSVALCSASTVSRFLSYPPRVREGLEDVGEWLVENGWTKGYAVFWNGDVLTELTDGQVEVWVVSGVDNLTIDHWLQVKAHDTAPEGKVFVLLKSTDNLPYFFEENLLYTDENGWVVMGYDSAEQLYALMEAGNAAIAAANGE